MNSKTLRANENVNVWRYRCNKIRIETTVMWWSETQWYSLFVHFKFWIQWNTHTERSTVYAFVIEIMFRQWIVVQWLEVLANTKNVNFIFLFVVAVETFSWKVKYHRSNKYNSFCYDGRQFNLEWHISTETREAIYSRIRTVCFQAIWILYANQILKSKQQSIEQQWIRLNFLFHVCRKYSIYYYLVGKFNVFYHYYLFGCNRNENGQQRRPTWRVFIVECSENIAS